MVCALTASALLPGCAALRSYQSRVAAEESFAEGAKAVARNDLATAREEFRQALDATPDSAGLHARIGLAYMPRLGEDFMRLEPAAAARALPHLERALELDPKQPYPVYLQAIFAAARLGRESRARAVLDAAATCFHDDGMALNDIGYLLVDANLLNAEALPLLERAVELEPKSGIILDSLGWAHYRLGNLRRAADMLETASDLARGNAEIEYHLGVVYAELGRFNDARAQFNRALEIAPSFGRARTALQALENY